MATALTCEIEEIGALFAWEGGEYVDILTRQASPGGEHPRFPGWYFGTDTINVWDHGQDQPEAPFTADGLTQVVREWLDNNSITGVSVGEVRTVQV